MGSSHGVDVMALHKLDVALHLPDGSVIPGVGIAVMPVHAFECNVSAVDFEHSVFRCDLPYAHALPYRLIAGGYLQGIQRRDLRRPQLRVGYLDFSGFAVGCGNPAQRISVRGN